MFINLNEKRNLQIWISCRDVAWALRSQSLSHVPQDRGYFCCVETESLLLVGTFHLEIIQEENSVLIEKFLLGYQPGRAPHYLWIVVGSVSCLESQVSCFLVHHNNRHALGITECVGAFTVREPCCHNGINFPWRESKLS